MIELVKPDLIAGNEKRFSDFISKLGKDKIALISHVADLDGIASAKIVNSVVNADILKFVNYEDLNDELTNELKDKKVKKIIITDVCIKNKNLIQNIEKFADILIIDHHPFEDDFNSEKTAFLNSKGFCASYLCYYLFSKIQNIEKYDWLAVCASISDWTYLKNADWMNSVYKKYGESYVGTVEGIRENKFFEIQDKISFALIYTNKNAEMIYSKIGENFGDIGELEKYSAEVKKDIENKLKSFNDEKINIKDVYFYEVKGKFPVSSYISTSISSGMPEKTIIVGQIEEKYYKFSARRQDKKQDMGLLLRKLTEGLEKSDAGGHVAAAGGYVLIKDKEEFIRRLKNL